MKKFILIFLSLICLNLQAKKETILPSIKPQNLSEIKLEGDASLIEKTTLTMEEAVQIALQNKPDLKAYQYAIEESRMRSKQMLAGYIPTISMTGDLSQTRGQCAPTMDVDFYASQLVLNFAGPIEQYKRAKKATQVVEYQTEQAKKAIRHEVEKAFLECWKVQQQNKAILALKKSSESTFEKAAHSNKVDLLNKRDWLKSTADHAQNLSTVDNYYQGAMISQKKLEFFMGQPVDLQITGIKELDSKYVNKKFHKVKLDLVWSDENTSVLIQQGIESLYDLALKNREDIKITDKNIAIAKDDIKLAQGTRLPVINLSFSTGTWKNFGNPVGELYPTQTRQNYQTVSANFSWNIFDGLVSYYQENQAHATMLKTMLSKEGVSQQIKFDVQQAYATLIQSDTQFKAKKFDLDRAKNELALQKQQFKIGNISKVELDSAQTDWDNTYYSWLETKIDVEIKKQDLLFACGYPSNV